VIVVKNLSGLHQNKNFTHQKALITRQHAVQRAEQSTKLLVWVVAVVAVAIFEAAVMTVVLVKCSQLRAQSAGKKQLFLSNQKVIVQSIAVNVSTSVETKGKLRKLFIKTRPTLINNDFENVWFFGGKIGEL